MSYLGPQFPLVLEGAGVGTSEQQYLIDVTGQKIALIYNGDHAEMICRMLNGEPTETTEEKLRQKLEAAGGNPNSVHIFFKPKPDITVYELSLCLPFAARMVRPLPLHIEEMEPALHRHFTCVYSPAGYEWAERFWPSVCHHCQKPLGSKDGECTGWHPDFKCSCGFEITGAPNYRFCPMCGKAKE